MLSLTKLRAGYGKLEVLRDVSLDFPSGSITLLAGHNGAGKSTVIKCIFGIVRLRAGRITLGDVDVSEASCSERVRRGIGYVPQTSDEGRGVFPNHSVRENLQLAAFVSKDRAEADAGLDRAIQFFPALAKELESKAGLLSGGQQQMLATAMALVLAPKVLLLDEPTSGLAAAVGEELMERLKEKATELGITVVLVEQNLQVAAKICDRAVIMRQGAVARTVTPQDVLGASSVMELI